jgi:hypothetical protein
MHRSRPLVLVILAAAAACSRHDPSEGNDILSQDRTLVAHLETNRDARRPTVPDACGVITLAAAPSAANQQEADELTQQAGVAEMRGNIQEARSLLQRASGLDARNKSAAYHLGRTSEALGDRTSAMTAYCRYLALAPTAAESTEARQRVANLSRPTTPRPTTPRSASGGPTNAGPTPASRIVASAPVRKSRSSRSPKRVAESPSVVPSGSVQPQTPSEPGTTSTEVVGTTGPATSGGDVVATSRPVPPADEPSPAPGTQRRSSIGVQSAIIGVATGAIIGAATGRSVKSTVIGAAAGGVLGTVVGTTTRPARRSIRS